MTAINKDLNSVITSMNTLATLSSVEFFKSIPKRILLCTEASDLDCALRLFKLAGTFKGAEFGGFKGKHKHRPNVDGFIPSRKSIIQRCADLRDIAASWKIYHNDAKSVPIPEDMIEMQTICYIDPPYVGTENVYLNKLSRKDVIEIALLWSAKGASVMISEAEPIEELRVLGWEVVNISDVRVGQARKNSKINSEFITYLLATPPSQGKSKNKFSKYNQ